MDCLGLKLVIYGHTAHLVSSIKDHFLQFQILYGLLDQDTALLDQFLSDTHYFPSRDTTHYQLVFVLSCSPVLITPQLLVWVNQFMLGMESIRLMLVKIHLCGLIEFLTFLLSCFLFLTCLHLSVKL